MKIWVILSTKMTITRKIKIGNLVFLSIQPIADLSSKLKKNIWFWIKSMQIKIQFFFSKVVKFTWKIWNRLNRKKNQISDFYFSSYAEKQCGRQFWNAVEREPVETRVLNPIASEASYKPKLRSYRKTKQFFFLFFSGGFWSGGFCRGDLSGNPNIVLHYIYTMWLFVLLFEDWTKLNVILMSFCSMTISHIDSLIWLI